MGILLESIAHGPVSGERVIINTIQIMESQEPELNMDWGYFFLFENYSSRYIVGSNYFYIQDRSFPGPSIDFRVQICGLKFNSFSFNTKI